MKKQYVKPSTEIFDVDTDSLLEVIGMSGDSEGDDNLAKENDMFDDEDEDEECLNSPNLWD